MPIITIRVLEGYDEQTRRRLGSALTDAARTVVPADPDAVTVIIEEMSAGNYLRGGEHRQAAAALPDPALMVREYLAAMEARDLERASSFLHDDFEMVFPGNVRMRALSELIEWAAGRYRSVRKRHQGFDVAPAKEGTIVYCFGTLSGEWPDGEPFDGIRYVDRFELDGGRIRRQQVWNDIAETRSKA